MWRHQECRHTHTHIKKQNRGIIIYIPIGHSDRQTDVTVKRAIISLQHTEGRKEIWATMSLRGWSFSPTPQRLIKKDNNNTVGGMGGAFVDYTFRSVLIHHHKRQSLTWLSDTNRHISSCLPSTSLLLLLLVFKASPGVFSEEYYLLLFFQGSLRSVCSF